MADLNLLGPMLRLVHRFYEQPDVPDVPDAAKVRLAWAMVRLVGDDHGERVREVVAELETKLTALGNDLPAGDWTDEDDRLAVHSRIADIIDLMPGDKLQRVLIEARRIRDEPDAPA